MEEVKGKKSNSYREAIVINGKVIKSPLFQRKTDCKQWLAEMKSNRAKNKLYGEKAKLHESIVFNEYASMWLKTKEAQGVSKSTLNNYERYVRVHFMPFFDGLDLKSIQKNHIESFQVFLRKEHNPKGINIIITALKGLFREAMREDYIVRNPCEFIKSFSSDNVHDVYWTTDEITQFLKANYEHELYDLFVVAFNSGCRKGELAGLCWDRVNFVENTLTISRTRDQYGLKERTKTNLKRVIPMTPLARAALLNLFNRRTNDSKFVFLKKNGEPIDPHHIYRQFQKAQAKAKIANRIRFHDCRHTAASQFMLNGGNIYDLQKILGHTSILMTQRYAHLSMEHLQKAMKNFNLGELSPNNVLGESDVIFLRKKEIQSEVAQNQPKILNSN